MQKLYFLIPQLSPTIWYVIYFIGLIVFLCICSGDVYKIKKPGPNSDSLFKNNSHLTNKNK